MISGWQVALLHVGCAERGGAGGLPGDHRQRQGRLRPLRPHPQQGLHGQAR